MIMTANIYYPCAGGKPCSKHLATQPRLILKIMQQDKYIFIFISQRKKLRVSVSAPNTQL